MLEALAFCKTHERDFTKYWYIPVSLDSRTNGVKNKRLSGGARLHNGSYFFLSSLEH
jgi:hypothetical protein